VKIHDEPHSSNFSDRVRDRSPAQRNQKHESTQFPPFESLPQRNTEGDSKNGDKNKADFSQGLSLEIIPSPDAGLYPGRKISISKANPVFSNFQTNRPII